VVTEQSRTTVLIADDEDDVRLLVKLRLELAGDIEVVAEAIDGDEALAAYEALDAPPVPHVVVLDNRMPGLTGLDVAALLRERVPSQRIVLYTAFVDEATIERAGELGIAAVVSKDNVAELPGIIRRVHATDA
jgi:DNA-binding NarL/FixJ family response regulator